ncbi:MAG TPA: aminopeptidase P family N-terminal domain-containing protein, partial [Candidatus Dormibacteraeota bacterium]|nr:aminopeptidase P family N-terminal domain-containing protein [Candidatus Dormibacteraeota bacterium]
MPTIEVPAITAAEYAARREALQAGMEQAGLDALVVFYPARVAYLTGFHHLPTERPVVFVLGTRGSGVLVVPARPPAGHLADHVAQCRERRRLVALHLGHARPDRRLHPPVRPARP